MSVGVVQGVFVGVAQGDVHECVCTSCREASSYPEHT